MELQQGDAQVDNIVIDVLWDLAKWSLIPVGAVALGMLLHEIPGWITCAILDFKLWLDRRKH